MNVELENVGSICPGDTPAYTKLLFKEDPHNYRPMEGQPVLFKPRVDVVGTLGPGWYGVRFYDENDVLMVETQYKYLELGWVLSVWWAPKPKE